MLSPSGRVAQGAERGLRLPELSLKVFPFAEKLSPSGRVARGAERGLLLPELSLKVFPLGGDNLSFTTNWEKVARMRRKRGAFILEIRADFIKQANFNG